MTQDTLHKLVEALTETRRLVSEASSSGFTDEAAVTALFVNNGAITRALSLLSKGGGIDAIPEPAVRGQGTTALLAPKPLSDGGREP